MDRHPRADARSSGGQAACINTRMATYYINLERSDARRARMNEMLAMSGLEYQRVPAVDGRDLTLPIKDFDERGYRLRHGRKPNPFEIGCYLSHVECARRLLESQNAHALILEDDVVFPPDMIALLNAALENNELWDLLRLSTVNRGHKYAVKKLNATRSLAVSLTREKGSGAYVINRRAAAWIMEGLRPMRLPFDLAFDSEQFVGLKALFVAPVPVHQTADRQSLIQNSLSSYRLSRWNYLTVLPYRSWYETTRFLSRLVQLMAWKFGPRTSMGKTGQNSPV